MLEDGKLETLRSQRYAGWDTAEAKRMLDSGFGLEDLTEFVLANSLDPEPRSGRQERLENLVNSYL